MLYKFEGIILKELKYKESDKILTIFTKEHGKIQAIVKGARNPKNKLFSSSQFLIHSELIAYKGKSLYNINQGYIINSNIDIKEDLIKLAYSSYLLELIDISTVYEEPNEKLFLLLTKTLNLLAKNSIDYDLLCRAFEIKYISFIGFKPVIKRCVKCNSELVNDFKFSINFGGILCKNCKDSDSYSININENSKKLLNFLMYNPLDKIENLKEKTVTKSIIEDILNKYILAHIEVDKIKSLEFLYSVK